MGRWCGTGRTTVLRGTTVPAARSTPNSSPAHEERSTTERVRGGRSVETEREYGERCISDTVLCRIKVVLRLSTTFAPVLQHGRIATIVICLHTLRRASTRKLNRFWQNWHLQRWLIVKSKSKMASRPRQRPSTTEKPTMTFSIKPRLICIITKTTVDGASTNIALTIRVAVKCHRQRLFSRDTKWPKAKY